MFYDTVGSENRKARSESGPMRTVGTQHPYGSTVVFTVQCVIACVETSKRKISRSFAPSLPQYKQFRLTTIEFLQNTFPMSRVQWAYHCLASLDGFYRISCS